MAGIGSKLESWLMCPVCQDTVRQPKTLQCFHSFCEECVTQLITTSHTDELGVNCPVCRAFTEQSMIKSNFLIKEMLEEHKGEQSGQPSGSPDRMGLPKLVLSAGNFSLEDNEVGSIEYRTPKMFEAKMQIDCRNPQKPFKDILQGKFRKNEQVKLKQWCKRISFICGDIWAAVPGAKCIQVIDMEGNPQRDISCAFKPYSVKQSPWGDIIVASDTGLHVLYPTGTVLSTISMDKFYDVCFFGEEIVGLNGSSGIQQIYSRSGEGEWRHSGDIGASRGVGSHGWDCVVTSGSEILFTMFGDSWSKYYKCEDKTGQRRECSNSKQALRAPFVCGVDSTGAVLVADLNNNRFQVHESEDQWSVFSLDLISSHQPLDLLYDADTESVWVLSQDNCGCYLTKLH